MKYLSLFSGIGGLEFGLRGRAECVAVSELRESSARIHRRNYGDVRNLGDITKVVPKSLPDFDILLGGFPCQSFSLAGLRKGMLDRRGQLIFNVYDVLEEKRPEWVVLENVKGLLSHDRGTTFKKIVALLGHAGYFVRVVLLNSMHYGSAQSRERLFFLGRRGKDFLAKAPEIRDDSKRFRDFRDDKGPFERPKPGEKIAAKIEQKLRFNFELIGGYDRVGTLTTQKGCGEKLVWDEAGYRLLTPLECERFQGFPDGWTEGESPTARYWALGNAVNCRCSDYLFNDYLKGVWW